MGSLSPAQENAWSRQGPPGEEPEGCRAGPRAPGSSPARPGIGFLRQISGWVKGLRFRKGRTVCAYRARGSQIRLNPW